jgi:hypothetical protein
MEKAYMIGGPKNGVMLKDDYIRQGYSFSTIKKGLCVVENRYEIDGGASIPVEHHNYFKLEISESGKKTTFLIHESLMEESKKVSIIDLITNQLFKETIVQCKAIE